MFSVSSRAHKKLKKHKSLKFWVRLPVVMLITHRATESSKRVLKPYIVSEKKLGDHYKKRILEIENLKIIPNFDVTLNTANADKWLLDIAPDGSFILFADGKLIEPYDPCKEINRNDK